jgi:tRNA(adenine34) deaminase
MIVYGASDPKRGYLNNSKSALSSKTSILGPIMEQECGSLLKSFFADKR